jgi:type I restriction enzyme M protein
MRFEEFAPCLEWWNKREENDRAWRVLASDFLKYEGDGNLLSANLDIKNPNAKEDLEHMPPDKLVEGIIAKEQKIITLMSEIREQLGQ